MLPLDSAEPSPAGPRPRLWERNMVNLLRHSLELSLHLLIRATWNLGRVFTASHIGKHAMGVLALKLKGSTVHKKKTHFIALHSCPVFIFSYRQDKNPFSCCCLCLKCFVSPHHLPDDCFLLLQVNNSNVTFSRNPFLVTWAKVTRLSPTHDVLHGPQHDLILFFNLFLD